MFRRSLSALASHPSQTPIPDRRQDSLNSVFANMSYDTELPQGVGAPAFGVYHRGPAACRITGHDWLALSTHTSVFASQRRAGALERRKYFTYAI